MELPSQVRVLFWHVVTEPRGSVLNVKGAWTCFGGRHESDSLSMMLTGTVTPPDAKLESVPLLSLTYLIVNGLSVGMKMT